jgi:hypothetical protein
MVGAPTRGKGSVERAASDGRLATTGGAPAAAAATAPLATNRLSPVRQTQLLRGFSGDGNDQLGTITLNRPAVLVWNAARPPVQVYTSTSFRLVDSGARSGSVELLPGTYPHLQVAAGARWSVERRSPR